MIDIQSMSFSFGVVDLFRDLSIEFKPGRVYGLLGKNGAGKTTLFKLIGGLLQANTGQPNVLGFNSFTRPPEMLQELFYIPETYYLPPVTIRQFESLHAPFYPKYDSAVLREHLAELELDEMQRLNTLSYGMSKRFMLAFGLATQSRILLLDEPTNGLDIPSKRVFRKLLAGGITEDRLFIIATHQIKEVETILDHLVFVDQGRILLESAVDQIASRLVFRKVSELDPARSVLYREEIAGGYAVIEANESDEESPVDLEFLFNAVLDSGEAVQQLLSQDKEVKIG